MIQTQGRRVHFPGEDSANLIPADIEAKLQPGDYWEWPRYDLWLVCAPNGDLASLRPAIHTIIEHEDGSISVHPSIQFKSGRRWHGYLERGVWREC